MVLFKSINVKSAILFTFYSCLQFSSVCSDKNRVRYTQFTSPTAEKFGQRVSKLYPLLNSAKSLCFFTTHGEIFSWVDKIWHNRFSIIFFDSSPRNIVLSCDAAVVFETNIPKECSSYVNSFRRTSVYFLSTYGDSLNISHLKQCLTNVSSPEVVAFSLSDNNSVYQLSPTFLQPRYFYRTSFAQMLKTKEQPQKVNLQGAKVTVAAMETNIPFFVRDSSINESFDGIEGQLVKEMSRRMNFSLQYTLLGGGWGSLSSNGSWVGDSVLRAMQNREADIGLANLWHSWAVYGALDFGPSMARARLVFVARRPERIEIYWNTILTLFESKLWFAVLACSVLAVIAYSTTIYWDSRLLVPPSTINVNNQRWLDATIIILGHLTLCSSHHRLKQGNSRFILASWSVFSLIITTSLSTGIVNRLTLPYYSLRVDTIRQLVEGQYYWTVEYYRRRRNNIRAKEGMFDLKNPWVNAFEKRYVYLEDSEIHKRTNSDNDKKIAFIVQRYGNDYVVLNTKDLIKQKGLKRFRVVKEATRESHNSIGVKKQSPLLEPLTVFNLRFLQFGLITHWKDEVLRRWPSYDTSHLLVENDSPTFKEPQKLQLDKIKPFFYMLFTGLSIAAIVFILEVCITLGTFHMNKAKNAHPR